VASTGAASIAAYLRRWGHEVGFLRVGSDEPPNGLASRVRESAPDVLALSLTSRQWPRARSLVAAVREEIDLPVIAGGLHPTFAPEQVLSAAGFDYVCIGEGEEPMLDLLEALERGEQEPAISNIWVRGGRRPAIRPPFEPIDDLPFMARDLLDEQHGVVHMATQRGCPFPCSFCAARTYGELYRQAGHVYGRRRSHRNVLDELFEIRERDGLSYVIFLDDTFTIHRPWVREFCKDYGARLRAPFSINARVETVSVEMIQLLAEAGCRHIVYGVESGSPRIRREVMHRPVENRRFRDVFRWTREAGITVTANYMIGLPGETRVDLEQTLRLAEELDAFDFGCFAFYPYPGTHLFRLCRDNGYLPGDYGEQPVNDRESILDLPGLTREEITEYHDRFTALRERTQLARQAAAGQVHERARPA